MDHNRIDENRDLLTKVKPRLEAAQNRRRKRALDFNVFEAAAISRREISHSAFLATLLDPAGPHGQETLFLAGFLDKLGIERPLIKLGRATVETEYRIENGRRLDILIRIPGGPLVAIENKVDAYEQSNQLSDYSSWLQNETQALRNGAGSPPCLVFLTPDGCPPTTGQADKHLAYADLAVWIRDSVKSLHAEATGLREIVIQYAELCDSIASGGVVKDRYDDELTSFLNEPKWASIALELEPYIVALRKQITDTFWANVRQTLAGQLTQSGLDGHWNANIEEPEFRNSDRALMLRPKGSAPRAKYGVGINLWSGGSFLTVERPQTGNREHLLEDASLVSLLRDRGYADKESEPEFCGWRFTSEIGLYNFRSNEIDVLRYQLNDNAHSEHGHPEAERVAHKIFELFLACREELERLNQKLS